MTNEVSILFNKIKRLELENEQLKNNTNTTIVCNSCGCGYYNNEGGCTLCEVEIRDGSCESFIDIEED